MKQMDMDAQVRTTVGKGPIGRARRQNLTPAVMYGRGEASVNLELTPKQIQQIAQTKSAQNVLIKLNIAGGQAPRLETVMIKAIQRHPVSSQVLHVDFMKILLDQALETKVPVVVTGTAPGVKEGGLLEVVHREVAIRCLPSLIPDNITLDVSALKIGDAIMVTDLPATEGIEILVDKHEPIVHVVAPRMEEEVKPAAAEAVPGAEAAAPAAAAVPEVKEPEVIGEKEREARRLEKEKAKKEKE